MKDLMKFYDKLSEDKVKYKNPSVFQGLTMYKYRNL